MAVHATTTGYHIRVAVTGGALTCSEEVWIPAVLATLCALFGSDLLKNVLLSGVGRSAVSPVRKAIEVLGTSCSSGAVMLFRVLVWDGRTRFDLDTFKRDTPPEYHEALSQISESAWYVRRCRRGAKKSLSRGLNCSVVAGAVVLSCVLLGWEFFLLFSQTLRRGSVYLNHAVENELAIRLPFIKSLDVDEADLKCKVTDITADPYVVVTNNFLSCRTISKSSQRSNLTSNLDIHYDNKDNYFLRAYSTDNAWFAVVSQSIAKPGKVVRATLQYEGGRHAQTKQMLAQLTAAVQDVSGVSVTNTTFVEKQKVSLTLSKNLSEEENRKLLRAVSAYVLRITNVKQGRKGTPIMTVDDGSGAKLDQKYTVEVGEYAVPRFGSRFLLILLLVIVTLSVPQQWLSRDENANFERLLWNGAKTSSPCDEEYSEYRDTQVLAPLMTRKSGNPTIHLSTLLLQGHVPADVYDNSIICDGREHLHRET